MTFSKKLNNFKFLVPKKKKKKKKKKKGKKKL